MAEATGLVDRDRLGMALDALLENAIAHTAADDLSSSAPAVRTGMRSCRWRTPAAASRRRTWNESSSGSPGPARPGPRGRGFGLGLAVVQAIAEAHHGSVRASSTLGQGSLFEVMLPAIAASPESPAAPEPVTAEMSPPDAGPAT